MKNDQNVRSLLQYGCEVYEAYLYRKYPDYDKLYSYLYPNGPRPVYDWLQGEAKAAAIKVPVPSIEEIHFPEAKPQRKIGISAI